VLLNEAVVIKDKEQEAAAKEEEEQVSFLGLVTWRREGVVRW
jgi:hypothetical protein